jgi:hypothetical protein
LIGKLANAPDPDPLTVVVEDDDDDAAAAAARMAVDTTVLDTA